MYSTRREFLRAGLQTSTLVALSPTVPGFLAQTARASQPKGDSRVLVVIQLDGGNDGINTVVPFTDEGYTKYRKVLRLQDEQLLKITSDVALHPAMRDAARLLESGRLAIIQGVGYPNPSRSHFKSMAIWHSANVNLPRKEEYDAETSASYGWIGQALDGGSKPEDGSPGATFIGTGPMPAALRSRRSVASALTRPEESILNLQTKPLVAPSKGGKELAAFVRRSTLDAYATSERMAAVLRTEDKGARYPATGLANRLRVIARLIKGGLGTRVFYTSQGGYDTHYVQPFIHADLLREFASSMRAFLDDLAAAGLAERVVVLAFSEFGRRVQENGSQGTDHGTAGPVFLAGPRVKVGLHGQTPKLLDLQDGDLKMNVDFRRVYASVLQNWLELPSPAPVDCHLEPLKLFRS